MKKLIALLLAAVLCLSLAACGEKNNTPADSAVDGGKAAHLRILSWMGKKSPSPIF